MFIIYTMAVWATFVLLHTHSCSAPTLLPWVQQWRSDAFSPTQKRRFPPQQKMVVVDAGCLHTLHQLKPQQRAHMVQKKHPQEAHLPSMLSQNLCQQCASRPEHQKMKSHPWGCCHYPTQPTQELLHFSQITRARQKGKSLYPLKNNKPTRPSPKQCVWHPNFWGGQRR